MSVLRDAPDAPCAVCWRITCFSTDAAPRVCSAECAAVQDAHAAIAEAITALRAPETSLATVAQGLRAL